MAYRFDHPVPEAVPVNLHQRLPEDWEERRDAWEEDCVAGAWTPRTRIQPVLWPCDLPDPWAWWREDPPSDAEVEAWRKEYSEQQGLWA